MRCSDCEFKPRRRKGKQWWVAVLAAAISLPGSRQSLVAAPVQVQETRLDNGLRLIVRHNPGAATVAVAGAVRVTAAQEPEGQEGLRQLVQLSLTGGAADAGVLTDTQTQGDFVSIMARAPDREAQAALKAVVDLALKAHFDSATIRGSQRVLERMAQAEQELALMAASRAGRENLYPAMARYADPRAARLLLAPSMVQRFYDQHFVPNNLVLVVSGPMDLKTARALVQEQTAGLLPGRSTEEIGVVSAPPRLGLHRMTMRGTDSVVWVGARAPEPGTRDYHVAAVTMAILGNGMGSRLYRRLREELRLAYMLGGQVMSGRLWPYMYVACTCDSVNVDRAREAIEGEVDRLSLERVSAAEIERAREVVATQLLSIEMSNSATAEYLAGAAVLGPASEPVVQPRELAAQIRQVHEEQVTDFAKEWWTRRVTVQLIGEK